MAATAGFVTSSPATAQCATSSLVEIPLGATTFYYDDRSSLPPVPGVIVGPDGTWIYEEANGEASLQRGGAHWLLGDLDAEICIQSANPDKLWF